MAGVTDERIGIVGTGNVAWHLARLCSLSGVSVSGVLVRNADVARLRSVGERFDVPLQDNLQQLASKSDVIIIAVNDQSIPTVASNLQSFRGLVCHTSGSSSIDVLAPFCRQRGVFYPLQTLTALQPVPPGEIPVCVEGVDPSVVQRITKIAHTLGCPTYEVNSHQRMVMHVAAVFACNFTNHMLALAYRIAEKEPAAKPLLQPLVKETIRKALQADDPKSVQTGPAIRNDKETLEKHLKLLDDNPEIQQLYQLISKSIAQS